MDRLTDKMRRRDFLGNGAKAAVGAAVLTAANNAARPAVASSRSSSAKVPQFILDSHIHCGGTEAWVEEMVRTYRRHNAMAFVLTWIGDMELMKDAAASHPDVFINCGRVNLDDSSAIREVETFKKNGFVGMKFHSPQKNYDDPSYFQIYRLCEEYRLHTLFHTGISSHRITDEPQWGSSARMRPMYLDTICRQFPRLTVQGAHLGNPWYEEAAEAARWNPTLYFDVTGSTLLKLIKLNRLARMSEILWWASDEAEHNPHTLKGGPGAWEHIVFGTDEKPSGLTANIERFQKMLNANNVPAAIREKMWGLTMAKVFGIDPKTRKFAGK
ncbi:MAG: hypothetical protein AMJ65_16695 [Phycisphaerae bacterium SG8_4]|nr:MAG: hypothetical protein AMJ65_16695 [Phycisphaerae bacterium SG8_4]